MSAALDEAAASSPDDPPTARGHHMYVVRCSDGTLYTGYTTDVAARVQAHNSGRGAKYTRAHGPVELLASASFGLKHEAMSAEYHFKRLTRDRKEHLLELAAEEPFEDVLLRALPQIRLGSDGHSDSHSDDHPDGHPDDPASSLAANPATDPTEGTDDGCTIRTATPQDVDAIAAIEAACFPEAEAATSAQFVERLAVFPNHFWVLEIGGVPVSVVNGMVTDSPTITDDLYADAHLHKEDGDWQALFGVTTLPEHRRHGYAARLLERAIDDARRAGRRGVILTCKDPLVHYYAGFGFVDEGVSGSVHGGAVWHDMRLTF